MSSAAWAQLNNDATVGGPGRVFSPPGNLYDNDVANITTSLASQDSAGGAFLARTADDFTLDGTGCASGLFDLTQVRVQSVQQNTTPQAWGIEIYADDGTGTSPTPTNAITPIASIAETSQTNLGAFAATNSLFEVVFDATGTQLAADTVFWISPFGTDAAQNAGTFNNFFAASNGAAATPANGVVIAPNAGVPTWTRVELVIGGDPLHFSFAIDGACAPLAVPTMPGPAIALLAAILLGCVIVFARRHGSSMEPGL